MIMIGSGAQHAGDAVRALAEELDAPVAAFRGGRGVVPEDHPLGISSYAAFKLWSETDALIGIGTRVEMPYMRWTGMMTLVDRPQAPPHLIRIDIDPAEMRRLVPHAGIVADADAGTRALLAAVRRLRGRKSAAKAPAKGASEVRARVAAVKAEARAAYREGAAAAGLSRRHPQGAAARRPARDRGEPDGLHLVFRLSGVRAAHLRVGGLPGHAGLRLPDRARASRWRIPTSPSSR